VEDSELPFEFMLNALRLVDGFALDLFTQRTGLPVTAITAELDRAEKDGLVERTHAHVRPTARGRRFLNELMQRFLPSQARRARTIPISTSSPGTSRPS
jgi:coproporphyrinogen III oxidase-like Fe-S oxidoreductase